MMKLVKSLFLALFVAGSAAAQTLDQANQLFEQRATLQEQNGRVINATPNVAKIDEATTAFKTLSATETDGKLAEVVEKLGRLAYYRGELLGSESPANVARGTALTKAQRAAVFLTCREVSAKLKGNAQFESTYALWHFLCSALWFREADLDATNQQRIIRELKTLFDQFVDNDLNIRSDRNLDLKYMGGGMHRVLAGTYANELSKNIRIRIKDDGTPDAERSLPNLTKALAFADLALTAGEDSNGVDGPRYFSNQRVRCSILKQLDRKPEAKQFAAAQAAALERLVNDNKLIIGYEAESFAELALLKDLAAE